MSSIKKNVSHFKFKQFPFAASRETEEKSWREDVTNKQVAETDIQRYKRDTESERGK